MLDVCSEMPSDKLKKQLQAVLTTYYEDIRSTQGPCCCPKPKFVTRSFVGTEEPDDASKHNDCTSTRRPLTQKTRKEPLLAPARWAPVGHKSLRSLQRPNRLPGAAAGRKSLMPI